MDPQKVVTCMPGAKLEEVVDDQTFVGSVKVKVGAITTSYKGRVRLTVVDEQAYRVQMSGEGRETGGGTAKGTLSTCLRSLPDGRTEVATEMSVDLTGRIMQVGRGMIQGVSRQLFQQFVASTKERLEGQGEAAGEAATATEAPPIRILPLILQSLCSAIMDFFRRLLGRPRP